MNAIDKKQLYGRFNQSRERAEKTNDLAVRKALDLPLGDDVNITTRNGISGWAMAGLLAVATAGSVGGAGLIGYMNRPAAPPAPVVAEPEAEPPNPQRFKVTFEGVDDVKVKTLDGGGYR